jgi:excinuclease ABC subunit C
MAIHELKRQIDRLPEQPGVYLFLGASGETLYVGKARVLRDRVRSYLGVKGTSPRLDALVRDVASLDVIVTDSVVEALTLENRLIKQRNPRFNVLLRDDKTYPYLQLTTTEPAPRLLVARHVARDGNVYAGPFMPASVARRTLTLAHRLFGIRSCNEVIDGRRDRPCLEYDIKRCLAPCVASICTLERYGEAVQDARLLIEGRQEELVERLQADMMAASERQEYERAAHLRDASRTVDTLGEWRNKMEAPSIGDRDAIGVKAGPAGAVVEIFQMRRGRVADRVELVTERDPQWLEAGGPDESALVAMGMQEFYSERRPPPEVHTPMELPADEREALELWLSSRADRRVRIVAPKRGDRRGLLELAARNAAIAYQSHFADGAPAYDAMETLRTLLALPALPRRIECFDISTFQGAETVASMVVMADGRMRKSDYRKYKIRKEGTEEGPEGTERRVAERVLDDFKSMHQVVVRRYQRALEQGGPFPDLIVIDGGKGQLSAAYAALRDVGLDRLVAIGLAKEEELIFTRDREDGIALPRESAALRLLQRIRDEAHRFAVTFHRQRRKKRDFSSVLDDIDGVGSRRRRQLLEAFGSVAGVRRASRDDLARVVGRRAADAVIRHFGT